MVFRSKADEFASEPLLHMCGLDIPRPRNIFPQPIPGARFRSLRSGCIPLSSPPLQNNAGQTASLGKRGYLFADIGQRQPGNARASKLVQSSARASHRSRVRASTAKRCVIPIRGPEGLPACCPSSADPVCGKNASFSAYRKVLLPVGVIAKCFVGLGHRAIPVRLGIAQFLEDNSLSVRSSSSAYKGLLQGFESFGPAMFRRPQSSWTDALCVCRSQTFQANNSFGKIW